MPKSIYRGTGRTTRQMKNIPYGGTFVVSNGAVKLMQVMAAEIGRQDIDILPIRFFNGHRSRGKRYSSLSVDHYAWDMSTADERDNIQLARRPQACLERLK